VLNGHLVERNELIFCPIVVKRGALIGTGAMIQPGVIIGENAVIASQSVVPKFKEIPAGEVWGGIPARKIKDSSKR
jgi:acetyltransferase-like isoleucine patch superfamily enzyme